jgi:hypothetical protein
MADQALFWFRRKYNLPPNDPRLLSLTLEDIHTEYWAHQFFEKPNMQHDEDDDWDTEEILTALETGNWEDVINDR